MSIFSIHTTETAPDAALPILEEAKRKYGFLPNLLGALAEAPAALEGYLALSGILDKSSFGAAEKHVVLIAASLANGCDYCVAAHAASARSHKVGADVIGALVEGRAIADPRLEALRAFTTTLVGNRGRASDEEVRAFIAAGFGRQQVLEVVLGVAFKTLSNYTNHLVGTPLDAAFAARAPAGTRAA